MNLTSSFHCTACGRDGDVSRGWRTYLVGEKTRSTITFCPECAERELGEDER